MSVKIFKGIPYTGTLPAVLAGTKAGHLHKYKIYGNLTQNGTPTPENPIMPSGCGVRTENLFDVESWLISKEAVFSKDGNAYTFSSTQSMYSTPFYFSDTDIPVSISGIITDITAYNARINLIRADGTIAKPSAITYLTNVKKSENIVCAGLQFDWSRDGTIRIDSLMLNLGSTALPYEPYGYKLPLTVNSVEYPIYLGEVETTRRIRKLVLTGEESIAVSSETINTPGLYAFGYNYSELNMTDILNYDESMTHITYPVFLSSHFILKPSNEYASWKNIKDGEIGANSAAGGNNKFLILCKAEITTTANFKSYLAAQYAAGTPVTVWYVLAEPETGIVNEPLMKIGDYADTIDSTQTSVQIPTTANSTTISWAGQGLEPSEFDSIAEWVSATPKIYTNGAWTDAQTYTYDDGAWVADN